MAGNIARIGKLLPKFTGMSSGYHPLKVSVRRATTTESGALLSEPHKIKWPVPKVLLTVLPFLVTGATLSKNGAALLEEMDIFVPEDDDD